MDNNNQAPQGQEEAANTAKLYVGNLPYSAGDDTLRDLFSEVGEVVDAVVIKHKDDMGHLAGKSKGFGFVEMSSPEEAAAAVEKFHESELDGRNIIVNIARPMQKRERSFGGGSRRYDNNRSGSNRY